LIAVVICTRKENGQNNGRLGKKKEDGGSKTTEGAREIEAARLKKRRGLFYQN